MDRDFGSKPGSGGAASAQNEAIDRRERLRRLALETIDLAKDPYFMRNHLGSYECKLCLTLHNNEGNYLAHTQGKRHQQNLAQRAAREAQEAPVLPQPNRRKVDPRKTGPCHAPPPEAPIALPTSAPLEQIRKQVPAKGKWRSWGRSWSCSLCTGFSL